jgi:hypothetical protein
MNNDQPGTLAPDRVYSFREFATLANISIETLRRLIRTGNGPTVTWMSKRRGGIRGRHASTWLDSKAK